MHLFIKMKIEFFLFAREKSSLLVKYEISSLSMQKITDRNKKQSCLDRANNLRIFHVSRIRTVIRIRYIHACISLCIPNPFIFTVYSCSARKQSARGAQTNPARSRTTNVFVPQLSSEV